MDDVKFKITKIWQILWKILLVIIVFFSLMFVAKFHEPWSDEAQAFLLARDNNLIELFKYIKFEGSPPLWHLIIKFFLLLGIKYNTYYIIPIIFTTIGTTILMFKKDIPWYIKLLLPFTFFIFYQYSIVARSYCLIFPEIMILSITHKNRKNKPILYAFSLIPFMMISLHTLLISGSIFLIYLIDIYKWKMYKDKKTIMACLLIFCSLLLVTIITFPNPNCYYAKLESQNLISVISQSIMSSSKNYLLNIFIFAAIVISLVLLLIKKENLEEKITSFIILALPIIILLNITGFKEWHYGIIFMLLLYFLITNELINSSTICKIFITIICIIQISWTINTVKYDYYNHYSASREVAEYLKYNDIIENKTICGIGFSITAIQPYFNHNIFVNQKPNDKAFWSWDSRNSIFFDTDEQTIKYNSDVYIISSLYENIYMNIINYLEDNGYEKKEFYGNTYAKDHFIETESYYVYVKNIND